MLAAGAALVWPVSLEVVERRTLGRLWFGS
jgi:hypothetical protein